MDPKEGGAESMQRTSMLGVPLTAPVLRASTALEPMRVPTAADRDACRHQVVMPVPQPPGLEASPEALDGPPFPRPTGRAMQASGSQWPSAVFGEQMLPCDPRFTAMDPYRAHVAACQAYYMAGFRDGARGGRMPPPGYDGNGQKTQRRRESSVPPCPAHAIDSLAVEQMLNDLEVDRLQCELKDLDGKEGAEADELRAKRRVRLQELKPQQKSGAELLQYFRIHFLAQGRLLSLACDKVGCRLVQAMLECADPDTTAEIVRELAPAVRDMAVSPHANYVVTKMIDVAPAECVGLIITHLSCHAEQIARHRYGCRIFCRLLRRSVNTKLPGLEGLLEGVLLKAQALCCHIFAHHVIESVLEHSLQHEHRHKIFEALCAELKRCAQDRHASFVVQAALQRCCDRDVEILADSLIDMLPELATTRFGSHVYNCLCEQESTKSRAIAALREAAPMLQESTHGRKLVEQVLDLEAPE